MLLHRVSVLPDESLIVALLSSLIVALQPTLTLVRKSTLEHYDFIEKIDFARKRLSIAATDRQRSAEIVATVTMG